MESVENERVKRANTRKRKKMSGFGKSKMIFF